uniref:Uncharacterized protein n=1 Tax=Cacopsylla melanoneura TaxID=428564 RepID=A0A8D8TEE8_9HEMI
MKLIGRVFCRNTKPSVQYKIRRYNGSANSTSTGHGGSTSSQKKVRRVSSSSSNHRRSKSKKVSLISLYSKLIKSKSEKRKFLNYLKHVYCILLYIHILKILLPR